ncbi:hypothetical protein [Streptomyces sp. RKCA744]|uniref:hypothetical protein n=1 Tax=Streptomyces sp. RKCA744 TaxID=2959340 RepID=UPI00209D04DB|nr:hypothetical protein [Streptomyces sp. RKCA744]MCO8308818.1 hypothetical protein [Streptomyces sp. RKCA744]
MQQPLPLTMCERGHLMGHKVMRRACASLVRDLQLPIPSDPDQVIIALCQRMEQRLGRHVQHRFVSFPPNTVSGLWVATDTVDYILCEEQTSPWHQLLITGHEYWHIEAEHRATLADGHDSHQLAFPSLDQRAVARIMAKRSHYDAVAEQEADLFATMLSAKLTRWLPKQTWNVPPAAADLVHRLEATLGGSAGQQGHS